MFMSRAAIVSAKIAALAGAICVVVAAPAMAATGSGDSGRTVAPVVSPTDGHPWDLFEGHPWDLLDGHPWDLVDGHPWD